MWEPAEHGPAPAVTGMQRRTAANSSAPYRPGARSPPATGTGPAVARRSTPRCGPWRRAPRTCPPTLRRPRPTSTTVPTMLRTIWWQNEDPAISRTRTPSPRSTHEVCSTRRTSETSSTPRGRRQNDEKSCSPTSTAAAAARASVVELVGDPPGGASQERIRHRRVQHRVAVEPPGRGEPRVELRRHTTHVAHHDRRGDLGVEGVPQTPLVERVHAGPRGRRRG